MKIASFKGKGNLVDWAIRKATGGIYSHNEAILEELGDGYCLCASSNPGNGVRIKVVFISSEDWDVVDVPQWDAEKCRQWFLKHLEANYDYAGAINFIFKAAHQDKKRWFCSEAIADSLGIPYSSNYSPSNLALLSIQKGITNG